MQSSPAIWPASSEQPAALTTSCRRSKRLSPTTSPSANAARCCARFGANTVPPSLCKERHMSDYPAVIPMLAYRDGPKAMDWLATAFGFKERARMTTPEGRLSHGEMEAGDGLLMLATPRPDHERPQPPRAGCEPPR